MFFRAPVPSGVSSLLIGLKPNFSFLDIFFQFSQIESE